MPKPRTSTGEKNLISQRLIELRRANNMSQRLLAYQLQLRGYDMVLVISCAVTRLLTSIDAHLLNFLSPVS